jgi:uncharacterized protein (TIGR04222 family)
MNTMLTTPMSTSTIPSGTSTPDPVAVLAADGDTWGIPGPTFVVLYIVLIVAALVGAMLARREIRAEQGRMPSAGWDADPYAVAFLNEGPALAVTAALSALHVDGLVAAEGKTVHRVGDPDATHRPRLEGAILAATSYATTRPGLGFKADVRAALDEIRAGLVERGLLLDDDQQRRMRRWGWVMLVVFALGLTRLSSGLAGGKAVGLLAVLLVVAGFAVAWLLFTKGPKISALAERELTRLRMEHQHLSPKMKPDWLANGALAAGMGVALFGAGALWAAAPAFANEIIARGAASSAGSYSGCGGGCGGSSTGSTGGSGCGSSGGSSCGGGGGGGGGGCGG